MADGRKRIRIRVRVRPRRRRRRSIPVAWMSGACESTLSLLPSSSSSSLYRRMSYRSDPNNISTAAAAQSYRISIDMRYMKPLLFLPLPGGGGGERENL